VPVLNSYCIVIIFFSGLCYYLFLCSQLLWYKIYNCRYTKILLLSTFHFKS